MPKETLTHLHRAPDLTVPEGYEEDLSHYNEFELHWSGQDFGGYAQLSMNFDVQNMIDYLTQLQKDSPTDKRTLFYSDVLTRSELQSLIKTARRARDAVFEPDA